MASAGRGKKFAPSRSGVIHSLSGFLPADAFRQLDVFGDRTCLPRISMRLDGLIWVGSAGSDEALGKKASE